MLKTWKAVKVEAQLPYKFDANEHSGISRLPKMFFDGLNMIQALLLLSSQQIKLNETFEQTRGKTKI